MKLIVLGIFAIAILINCFVASLGSPMGRSEPIVWSFNLADLPGHMTPISRNGYTSRQSEEEDDPTFRDAVSAYGRNRWNNFRNSFTEFWDIVRAGGRGVRGWFVNENDSEK